jgi:hypothetical protein
MPEFSPVPVLAIIFGLAVLIFRRPKQAHV